MLIIFLVDKDDNDKDDNDNDSIKNNDYLILLKKMEILTNSKIKHYKIDDILFESIYSLLKMKNTCLINDHIQNIC